MELEINICSRTKMKSIKEIYGNYFNFPSLKPQIDEDLPFSQFRLKKALDKLCRKRASSKISDYELNQIDAIVGEIMALQR